MSTVLTGLSGLHEGIVGDWILGLRLGFEAPLRFERIGNGHSNLTYRVSDPAGMIAVLRRPPFGPLLPSAHDVARENRILRALEATRVAAPAVYGFTDDAMVSDVPLLLTEFVDGAIVADLDEQQGAGFGSSLVGALTRVHEVGLAAAGLDDLASHAGQGAARLAPAYPAETGRDLTSLPFWHALALWKVAIICEGVRRRALEHDQNAPPGGAPPPEMVERLVERAWLVVEEAGL